MNPQLFERAFNFRIDFDWYTPRPHLIILNETFPGNGALTKDQETQLFQCFLRFKEELQGFDMEFQRFALVSHHGSYLSKNTKEFHAHIWMDEAAYLNLLCSLYSTPSPKRDKYINRVKTYPGWTAEKHSKYLNDERQDVLAVKATSTLLSIVKPSNSDYELVYHKSLPNIGFRSNGSKSMQNVWLEMNRFAKLNGMRNKPDDDDDVDDGCHVCIMGLPNGPPFPGGNVDGYILARVKTYYSILRGEISEAAADQWMKKYEMDTCKHPVLS